MVQQNGTNGADADADGLKTCINGHARRPMEMEGGIVQSPTVQLFTSLQGKTALVTGANGGIGFGIAQALAELGADIIIIQIPGERSTKAEELRVSTGRRVDVYNCDLSCSADIRRVVKVITETDGRAVDVLVNCAGMSSGSVPILEETDEHREKLIAINLNAPYILSQTIGQSMIERGNGGKIINIASMAAWRAQMNMSVYAATKAGVAQLTASFANEFGKHNIQVNAILPGWIRTPMARRFVENKEFSESVVSRTPAGRWGEPSDFRGITAFLATSASDFVTGTRIALDGGWSNV